MHIFIDFEMPVHQCPSQLELCVSVLRFKKYLLKQQTMCLKLKNCFVKFVT